MKYFITTLVLLGLLLGSAYAYQRDQDDALSAILDTIPPKEKAELLRVMAFDQLSTDAQKSIDLAREGQRTLKKYGGTKELEADFYNILGTAYYYQKRYLKSIQNYESELEILRETKSTAEVALALSNLGTVSRRLGKNSLLSRRNRAAEYFLESLELMKEHADNEILTQNYQLLSDVYEENGDFDDALKYYKLYVSVRDTVIQEQVEMLQKSREDKDILLKKKSYSLRKAWQNSERLKKDTLQKSQMLQLKDSAITQKEQILQERDSTIKEKDSVIVEKVSVIVEQDETIKAKEKSLRLQRTVLIITAAFIAVVLFGSFLLMRMTQRIKKANHKLALSNEEITQQKEEIEAQRDEIEKQRDYVVEQRDYISKQKQEITDSIHYASRIQDALLPPANLMAELLPEHFVLFKPRDIVSGDFYWMRKLGDKVCVIAADCTGHGVPGAFMSMLGISFLNEIATRSGETASDLLNQLRDMVKESLRQNDKESSSKDGMDLVCCLIDTAKLSLQYAGAYNPLWIYRKNELLEYKADKMPIGVHRREKPSFTNHEVKLQKGDAIYMFSDGYADQFGGPDGRKFMSKQLKQVLSDNHKLSMAKQKQVMEQTIEQWKGTEEQLDDILMIGIRM